MTEAEWLAATDTTLMRRFLLKQQLLGWTWRGRFWQRLGYQLFPCTRRKVALFALACCRHCWQCFEESFERPAIEAVERFIDGSLAEQVIRQIKRIANDRPSRPGGQMRPDVIELLIEFSLEDCAIANNDLFTGDVSSQFHDFFHMLTCKIMRTIYGEEEFDNNLHDRKSVAKLRQDTAKLLRDIFGNPFRPVTANPSWLTSTVLSLAEGIYSEKAFDRLPILADSLMDGGCDNEDILNHCRSEGPHVRGCWVVDLLTGRS